jgi:8-oxo-dGTP diphosphatase
MKNVTAAIIIKNNRTLLAKRSKDSQLAGKWEFPGGKQETGESLRECLEREVLEELGVYSDAGDIYLESVYHYEHGSINLIGMFTNLESYEFSLSVHDEIEWVDINDILKYDLTPADIPIAKKLLNDFQKT